jgi:hypothetical protein
MSVEHRFSREILIGALCYGLDLPSMAKALKVREIDIFALSAGKRALTARQASVLGRLSGVSVNELALRGVRATGDPVKVDRDSAVFDATAAMFAERRTTGSRLKQMVRRRLPA